MKGNNNTHSQQKIHYKTNAMKKNNNIVSVKEIADSILAFAKYDSAVDSIVSQANAAVTQWKEARAALKEEIASFKKANGNLKELRKALVTGGLSQGVLSRLWNELGIEGQAKPAETTGKAQKSAKIEAFAVEFVTHAKKEAKNKELALAALRKATDLLRKEIAAGK